MLPHPIATSYFQDDLGLLEGFCRIATHKYISGVGERRLAKIENINEGDLFYNNNTAISIYRKDPLSIGGNAEISLNTFYKNSSSFSVDDFSKSAVLINYSDGILPLGKTKTIDNLKDSLELFIDYQK